MIHLIRHGPKAWDNGRGGPVDHLDEGETHDPPLDWLNGAGHRVDHLSAQLLAQEDEPAAILSSPFLRCRQTAEILAQRLEEPMLIDCSLLREYLGNWRGSSRPVRITQQTDALLGKEDSIVENWEKFSQRAHSTAEWLIFLLDNLCDGRSLWVVTHGALMRKVNRILVKRGYPVALHWLS